MKRIAPLILLLFITPAKAYPENCFSPRNFNVYVPVFKNTFKFDVGVFYLRPGIPHLDYAATVQEGDIQFNSLNPAYHDWSYEIGAGYNMPCSANEIRFNYSHLSQDDTGDKERGDLLLSTVSRIPQPVFTDRVTVSALGIPVDTALASGGFSKPLEPDFIEHVAYFRQDRLDLELGQSFHVSPYLRFRYSSGFRGAKLIHRFTTRAGQESRNDTLILAGTTNNLASGTFAVPFTETVQLSSAVFKLNDEVKQKSLYTGIGPRVSLEADYYLDIGISLFARMSSALLVGEINSAVRKDTSTSFSARVESVTTQITNPIFTLTPGLVPGDVIDQTTTSFRDIHKPNHARVIPNLESRVGISYVPCLPCTCSRVILEAGYLVNHYFNAVERIFDNTVQAPVVETCDVTYDGLYFKIAMII